MRMLTFVRRLELAYAVIIASSSSTSFIGIGFFKNPAFTRAGKSSD
jgi:hypothetical protein